jgi:hypothetical protein
MNVNPARMSEPYGSIEPPLILHLIRTVVSLAKTTVTVVIAVVRMPLPVAPAGPVEKVAISAALEG